MKKNLFLRAIAIIWGISGVIILVGVFWPIVSYRSKPVVKADQSVDSSDFTKASSWFVGGAGSEAFRASKISFYNLSVPKLKIEKAIVAIGGEDLAENLIQYPGTALPGKKGNAVIFGHSVLPIFFNPKEYISIFSTLSSLKVSDEIYVNYDNIDFTYRVESFFEVLPTDIQVLQQDTSDSFLTLVTCVPPGDPRRPKRLIVRARIVPL